MFTSAARQTLFTAAANFLPFIFIVVVLFADVFLVKHACSCLIFSKGTLFSSRKQCLKQ